MGPVGSLSVSKSQVITCPIHEPNADSRVAPGSEMAVSMYARYPAVRGSLRAGGI
jgi:hypothetical protein